MDKIKKNCLEYFEGDELATSVLINKYLLRDSDNNFIEKHPSDLFKRISSEFARIEKKFPNSLTEEQILNAINKFKYIVPGGSILFGAGNNYQISSLANCFFIGGPEDNYTSIIFKDCELANIFKRRGGGGLDLSKLRPSGSKVNNAARTSDGITCFMERYSNTTKEVAQNGRRGALIQTIDCRHPDIEKFITIKRDLKKVTAANISIKWTDAFLKAVEKDEEYTLQFPVDVPLEKALYTKNVKAREIFNKFIRSNWESAEPGCLFWDTVLNQSLSDCYKEFGFETGGTNPCGELVLNKYGICLLMSINLFSFVDNPFTKDAKFDFNKFDEIVNIAVRMMDDSIELEIEKIDNICNKIKHSEDDKNFKDFELNLWHNVKNNLINGRRTGLGILGLADMLAALNIKYDSNNSLKFIEEIFKRFNEKCIDIDIELAKERKPFPIWNWELEKDCHYIKILPKELQEKIKKFGRRNIAQTTIPPAGSISILTQTSSGIEPIFKRKYIRRRKVSNDEKIDSKNIFEDEEGIKWISYEVLHHGLEKWKKINPDKKIDENPYINSEAGEIDYKNRIKIQSIMQKYIHHSISSTCNLKKETSEKEIYDLYLMAWKEGLKGVTIYRDGSRTGILTEKKDNVQENDCSKIKDNCAPKRPNILQCDIHYSTIEGKSWVFFVGLLNNRPYDIFGGKKDKIEIPKKFKKCWIKKNGKDENGRRTYDLYIGSLEESDEQMVIKDIASVFSNNAGSYTRLVSTMLRHGIPIKFICEQLLKDEKATMFSMEKCIARVLKKYIKDGELSGDSCSSCGGDLVYKDGCVICMSCGNSKCS